MRTTLTLEDDLAKRLKEVAHRSRRSFKEILNEILRKGLEVASKPTRGEEVFRVEPRHCGFAPGVDTGRLNQLLDELDASDFQAEQVED